MSFWSKFLSFFKKADEEKEIVWKENGWTVVQDADAENHVLEISAYSENGSVTEIRIRHNDGEEAKGSATMDGKNALPMSTAAFAEAFLAGKLEIK